MPNSISIELLGRNEVKITDRTGETERLFYDANSKSVMPEEKHQKICKKEADKELELNF